MHPAKVLRQRVFIKSTVFGLAIFIMLMTWRGRPDKKSTADQEALEGRISISASFALYPLILKLAGEFQAVHPGLRFDISACGASKSVSDTLNGLTDLGGLSREIYPQERDRGLWSVPIARDAVLAIISADNPCRQVLSRQGVTRNIFVRLWIGEGIRTWGDLIGVSSISQPIHVYTHADSSGAGEIWAQFLGAQQENLRGIGVHGESWMAGAVKNDPFGIGYTNLNFAYDTRTQEPVPGILIVPIDLNENGQIDLDEDFYSTRLRMLRAIAWEDYTSQPSRDHYLISRGIAKQKRTRAFLIWALARGQHLVSEAGYIPIPSRVLEEALHSLSVR